MIGFLRFFGIIFCIWVLCFYVSYLLLKIGSFLELDEKFEFKEFFWNEEYNQYDMHSGLISFMASPFFVVAGVVMILIGLFNKLPLKNHTFWFINKWNDEAKKDDES